MSGFSIVAPLGLLGLIALPVIVVLYMRTTTPTERKVPSTRFWLTAQTSPSETRRFRLPPITPLFLLHLLTALLITLALARPASAEVLSRFGSRTEPKHVILVVDGSTSMLAYADELGPAGRTRFELAKQKVRERLGDLHNGDVATVLVLGTRTMTFQASDAIDIGNLRDQIDSLPLPGGRANLNDALRLCQDLLLPGLNDEIVIVTDGSVAVDPAIARETDAPITLELVNGSVDSANLALTEITVRGSAQSNGRQDLFLRVVNFSNKPMTTKVTISADDTTVSEVELDLQSNSSRTVTQLLPDGARLATALLDATDAQPADNIATISLAGEGSGGARILLVSDQPTDLLRALNALQGSQVEVLSQNQYLAAGTPGSVDLVVFEGGLPLGSLPQLPTLIVNPGTDFAGSTVAIAQPEPIRVQSQDPILNGVDLAGVTFGQAPAITLAPTDFEIVGADGGPLIYRTTTAANQHAIVLAFDIAQSNLPLRVSFPILVSNLVSDLVDRNVPLSLAIGDPLVMSLRAGTDSVQITDPTQTGQQISASSFVMNGQSRQLTYVDTGQAGLYQVQELDASGGTLGSSTISVNAGHQQESNLALNPLLAQALQSSGSQVASGSVRQSIDLWPLLLIATLLCLFAETILTLRQQRTASPVSGRATS